MVLVGSGPTSIWVYLCQELMYEFGEDEAWKTWPSRQSLTDFTQSSAKPLVVDIVDNFFQQLLPPLRRLQQKVSASVRDANLEFDALKDTLELYSQTTVLGSEFVRYASSL